MDDDALNDDWIKTRSWDIWAAGPNGDPPFKEVETVAELIDAVSDPWRRGDEALRHFLTLPASLAMPSALRERVDEYLTVKKTTEPSLSLVATLRERLLKR